MAVKIVPHILDAEIITAQNKLRLVEGLVDTVGIDIVDGRFADNVTIGMDELMELTGEADIEIQLITEEPINYVNQCAEAQVSSVLGHIELMDSQLEFLDKAKKLKMLAGIALDLPTPIDFIDEGIIDQTDKILLMAVPAGFSNQKFNHKVLTKIADLRKSGFEKEIIIDGGVNEETIAACVEAGADTLAITSTLWKAQNVPQELKKLQRLAEAAENDRIKTYEI